MNRWRLIPMVVAGVCAVVLAGCKTNLATGDKILSLQSRDDLIKLGTEAAPEFTQQFGGEVSDTELRAYVTGIGSKMAAKTEGDNPSLPWEFTLLNTDVINAFALPGGKVFFTRGLAAKLDNEAQMAGVLGHEIGHVTAEHAARRMSQQLLFNVGVAGAAVAVGVSDEDSSFRKWGQYGVPALAVGGNLVILKFGRDEESQADKLGMRYMSSVGYNPAGQKQVMEILASVSGGGARGAPEWLATHPYPETRVQRIDALLQTEYANTRDNPQYVFKEQEYKTSFLSRLNRLPAAPKPPPAPAPTGAVETTGGVTLSLGDPATWCGHCAVARRADSGQWTMDSGHW